MPKVFIIDGNYQYLDMFFNHGWEAAESLADADLVQFTGGADVSPMLYGERCHPQTHYLDSRDAVEARAYSAAFKLGIPMAGICRGGQFLNVMCGGRMWQHVDRHAIGDTHGVVDVANGKTIQCTSTHHQMMRPSSEGVILGVASEATFLEHMDGRDVLRHEAKRGGDVEVVLYPDYKVLCFQPHPEYLSAHSDCQKWYFKLIKENLVCAD